MLNFQTYGGTGTGDKPPDDGPQDPPPSDKPVPFGDNNR